MESGVVVFIVIAIAVRPGGVRGPARRGGSERRTGAARHVGGRLNGANRASVASRDAEEEPGGVHYRNEQQRSAAPGPLRAGGLFAVSP
jgi:hypothetical protein